MNKNDYWLLKFEETSLICFKYLKWWFVHENGIITLRWNEQKTIIKRIICFFPTSFVLIIYHLRC